MTASGYAEPRPVEVFQVIPGLLKIKARDLDREHSEWFQSNMSVLDLMAKTAASNGRLADFVCDIATDNAFVPQLQKMAGAAEVELSVVRRWLTNPALSELDRDKLQETAAILEKTQKKLSSALAKILV